MMVVWIAIGLLTGLIGMISISLSSYILKVEDGEKCRTCENRKGCFARKKIFKNSNMLSEFMLLTFLLVNKYCKEVHKSIFLQKVIYIFLNTMLILILFWSKGWNVFSIVFSVSTAAMLALAMVDWNTQYIPMEFTGVVMICGLIRVFADFSNWVEYVIGLFAVSGFLLIVNFIATPILKKKYQAEQEIDSVIGDGDIKLMAATGLLLGWKLNFLALGIGCIAGSVIHIALMKIKGSDRQFALGPYLSLGVYITMICGEQLVSWYLNMMGVKPI